MRLKLKPAVGQKIDIGQGEYRRRFKRADEPFTVDEGEATLLLNTGLFDQHVDVDVMKEEPSVQLSVPPPSQAHRKPTPRETKE